MKTFLQMAHFRQKIIIIDFSCLTNYAPKIAPFNLILFFYFQHIILPFYFFCVLKINNRPSKLPIIILSNIDSFWFPFFVPYSNAFYPVMRVSRAFLGIFKCLVWIFGKAFFTFTAKSYGISLVLFIFHILILHTFDYKKLYSLQLSSRTE